jgi:methanogenic corrinoid protein MtbC1
MNEFEKEAGVLEKEAKIYLKSLLKADRLAAIRIVNKTMESGCGIKDIYIHIFQASQYEIGRLWQTNRINVAQEHYCTAATQAIMSRLYPYVFRTKKNGHRLVASCINGDLHEIGLRMVADILEMEGWDTYYLGANTPLKSLLASLSQYQAEVLCISATINYNVSALADLITAVRKSPDAAKIKILAGGRPFNIAPNLWWKVGADGYGKDAGEAVSRCSAIIKPGFKSRAQISEQDEFHAISREALAAFRAAAPRIIRETVTQSMKVTADIKQHGDQAENIITAGMEFTLRMLDSAMAAGETALLADELMWAKDRLAYDGVSLQQVGNRLKLMRKIAIEKMPSEEAGEVTGYIDWMIAKFEAIMKGKTIEG